MAKQTTSTPQGKPAKVPSTGAGARKVAPPRASSGPAPAQRLGAASLTSFFQQSWAELHRVTWPTRQETTNLTIAVIVMTVGIAVFLGIMDSILAELVRRLIGISL